MWWWMSPWPRHLLEMPTRVRPKRFRARSSGPWFLDTSLPKPRINRFLQEPDPANNTGEESQDPVFPKEYVKEKEERRSFLFKWKAIGLAFLGSVLETTPLNQEPQEATSTATERLWNRSAATQLQRQNHKRLNNSAINGTVVCSGIPLFLFLQWLGKLEIGMCVDVEPNRRRRPLERHSRKCHPTEGRDTPETKTDDDEKQTSATTVVVSIENGTITSTGCVGDSQLADGMKRQWPLTQYCVVTPAARNDFGVSVVVLWQREFFCMRECLVSRLLLRHVTGHNRDVMPSNNDGNMFPSGFPRHFRQFWDIDKTIGMYDRNRMF